MLPALAGVPSLRRRLGLARFADLAKPGHGRAELLLHYSAATGQDNRTPLLTPKFVKQYANLWRSCDAFTAYHEDVKVKAFPEPEHLYSMV